MPTAAQEPRLGEWLDLYFSAIQYFDPQTGASKNTHAN
jgi:hypothetical protein